MAIDTKHFKTFSIVNGDIKVQLNLSRFEQQYREAQWYLDNQVMQDMKPYMPFSEGDFYNITAAKSEAIAGSGMVIAGTEPMGRSLYEGIKMVDPVYHVAGFQGKDGNWYSRKGIEKVEATKVPGVKNPYWNFSKNTNPKATDHWFDAAKEANKADWIKQVKKIAGGG